MMNLSYFNQCKENGEIIKVVFNQVDRERAQYVAYINKLRVVLPLTEYFGVNEEGLAKIWKTARIGKAIGAETDVVVESVNTLTGTITCSRKGVRAANREKEYEEEHKAIEEGIAKKEFIKVSGRIIGLYGKGKNSFAHVRTEAGHNFILGVSNWDHVFIEDIRDGAKMNQVVNVEVYRACEGSFAASYDYHASRRNTIPAPEKTKNSRKEYTKEERRAIFDAGIANGSPAIVSGRVVEILGTGSNSRAIIATKEGVRMCLMCSDYDYGYVEDIRDKVKVNYILKVVVYAKNIEEKLQVAEYLVSRRRLLPNPWVGIEDKFHKGDIVRCSVDCRRNGGFGGRVEGLDDIVAFISYPKDMTIRMAIGGKYICSVTKASEEKRLLKLFPFAILKEDSERNETNGVTEE